MAPGRRAQAFGEGYPERKGRGQTADSATLEEQCHPRKVFVGGLSHKSTTQHLRDYFEKYGPVTDVVVLRWPDGRSRGFGYVTFADASLAARVLIDSHVVNGRQVDVKRAVPGTNKLFVGGLPQNATACELREYFEAFGVVSDAVVMMDAVTNRSRGFGFICFLPGHEGAAAMQAALEKYSQHRMRGKWIEVKSAAPPHKLPSREEAAAEAMEAAALKMPNPCLHPQPDPSAIAGAAMAMAMAYAAASQAAMPAAAAAPEGALQTGARPVPTPQVNVSSPQKVPPSGPAPWLDASPTASSDMGPPGLSLPRAPPLARASKAKSASSPQGHLGPIGPQRPKSGLNKMPMAAPPPPGGVLSLSSALGFGPADADAALNPPDAKASPKYDMWQPDGQSIVASQGLHHSLEQLLRLHTSEVSAASTASSDKKER